ncbi:hypothetical protein JD81_00080 [Micromonospora sagamiensis]|uniref:Uncharacterized protein n=1 Tax=Micromonospora sagamiensis TaxID=47875 RepID=A0A562W8N6_9ACTN|nr:hypothetical protein [Micromonospora sagamiensis]TWJ26620.1 hypothetical protein JD81_00080 [Micromonospora sagamiensis]
MTFRQFLFIAALLAAASVAGSGVHPQAPVAPTEPVEPVTDEVIDLHGLAGVEFGDSQRELVERGMLHQTPESCGPALVGQETASPVFRDDRLVLLWVSAPVRTPEGVTVGTPVGDLRSRFPSLTRLDAPEGTYRFDGLLAQRGDRAYLFLHDGRTVRKTIAGYADYAQRLFDEGHGPC